MSEALILPPQVPVGTPQFQTEEPAWVVDYLDRATMRPAGFWDLYEAKCNAERFELARCYRWAAILLPFFDAELLEEFDSLQAAYWSDRAPAVGIHGLEPTNDAWGPLMQVMGTAEQTAAPVVAEKLRKMQAKKPPRSVSLPSDSQRGTVRAGVVALMLDCTQQNVYEMAKAGRIPNVRWGSSVRFDLDQIRTWIKKHSVA